jgi:hypothetical protein
MMTIPLRAFEYSSFLHYPDSIRTYEFASSNAYLNVVERASRRVSLGVFVERNDYFSFTFSTKMSALLLKASPFSPSVLALAKTNTKRSSLRSQRKQSSSDVVVVSASAGVGQGTSHPSLPSLARVRLRFLFCYPFAGKSINLSTM